MGDVIGPKKEADTIEFSVKNRSTATVVAADLSSGEAVTFEIEAKEGVWVPLFDFVYDDFFKLTSTGNIRWFSAPGEYRVLKPVTASPVLVSVIYGKA